VTTLGNRNVERCSKNIYISNSKTFMFPHEKMHSSLSFHSRFLLETWLLRDVQASATRPFTFASHSATALRPFLFFSLRVPLRFLPWYECSRSVWRGRQQSAAAAGVSISASTTGLWTSSNSPAPAGMICHLEESKTRTDLIISQSHLAYCPYSGSHVSFFLSVSL